MRGSVLGLVTIFCNFLIPSTHSEIQVYRYVDDSDNLISNHEDYFASLRPPASRPLFSAPPTTFRPPFRPSAVSAPPPKRYLQPVYIRPEPERSFTPPPPQPPRRDDDREQRRPNPHYIQSTILVALPTPTQIPQSSTTTPIPEDKIYLSSTTHRSTSTTFATTFRTPTSTRTPSPSSPTPSYLERYHPLGMEDTENSFSATPPSAEVFLTKGNTEEETIPLGLSNSRRGGGGGGDDAIRDILITPGMVRNGSEFNHVVLLCNASYPVEWIYQGVGAPMLYTTQIRTFGNFFDPSTYGHSNIVVLVQDRLDERQTGSYICRGIAQPDLRTGFHLYFKGEFGFPSLQNVLITPKSAESTILIPCPSTDPSATIGLYKVSPSTGSRNLTLRGGSFAYDPRTGFSVKLSDMSDPFGTYICKFNDLESDWRIQVVQPKYEEVQVFPNGSVIKMDNLTDHSFTCRGKEPIQIMLPNTVDFGRVEYSEQFEDEFPYLARLTITPTIPLFSVANYFKINCQSRATRRVLHSWEYSNFGSEEISVSYDPHHKRLLCCTKSGLTPRHEMAKCETVTDCRIKSHCFSTGRCDYAFPPRFVDAPRGCSAIEFMDDFPSHVMQCSVGGGHFSRTTMVSSNIANDNLIIYDGGVPKTEEILKVVEMKGQRRSLVGRGRGRVEVRCVASIFYFSTNIVFAFQMRDGSLEFADEGQVENVNSYGPTLKTILPPGTTRIICFAPLTRSSEWRNASLDITTTTTDSFGDGGRFSVFPAVAKNRGRPNQERLYTFSEVDEDDVAPRMDSEEDNDNKERIVTSVKTSKSVTTFLRKKQGRLIRVMQDI